MRSYEDVDRLKLGDEIASADPSGLPPGYFVGFKLTINEYGQLVINEGTCNIRGKRVDLTTQTIFDTSWYTVASVVKDKTYYLYIDWTANIIADPLDAVYDVESFGYYHSVQRQYRYLGQFDISSAGTYVRVVSQDPVTSGDIEAALVGATSVSIGYAGDGTLIEPEEGDRRVYIDEDEIGFEEYTSGAWSTIRGIKSGGQIATQFAPLIACNGLYHPENPPTNIEYFLGNDYRIFNFENNMEDHLGVDDWGLKNHAAYNSVYKKFGSYSLYHDGVETGNIQLQTSENFDIGQDQAYGFWIYITNWSSDDFATSIYFGQEGNQFLLRVRGTYSTGIIFPAIIISKGYTDTTITGAALTVDTWHFIALTYKSSTDTITLIADNNKYTQVGITGTWGSVSNNAVLESSNRNDLHGIYIDELIYTNNKYVNPNWFVQHYNHNVAWATDLSKNDIQIRPNTDGKVIIYDYIRAGDSTGLILQDDGGNTAITIADGGAVTIGKALTLSSTLTAASLGTGTDNSVLVLNSSNAVVTDEINSKVWETTIAIVDATDGVNNRVPTFADTDTIQGEANLTFDGTTLGVTGALTVSTTITCASIGADTDNSVVILNSSGLLKTDEIDPRVWGATLVDYSGTTAGYIPKMSDADTIANSPIYTDGTNVGIGTSSPGAMLEVNGAQAIWCGHTTDYTVLRSNLSGIRSWQIDNVSDDFRFFDGTNYSFTIKHDTGNVGLGTSSPSALLDINSDILRLRTAKTPASSGAAGNAGDICWDASYIYICTAANTWERAAIATWV